MPIMTATSPTDRSGLLTEALDRFPFLPDGVGVDVAAKTALWRAPSRIISTAPISFLPSFCRHRQGPLTARACSAPTRANAEAAYGQAVERLAVAAQIRSSSIDSFFSTTERAGRSSTALRDLRPARAAGRHGRAAPGIVDRPPHRCPATATLAHRRRRAARFPPARYRGHLCLDATQLQARMAVPPDGSSRGRLWRRYVVGNPVFLLRVIQAEAHA